VAHTIDASKDRRGAEQALALAHDAERVVVGRGKKVIAFDMANDPPDNKTLIAHLLGPTGNLRAPTLRLGKTLLVGFSAQAYQEILGT
jgi:hypothetical protein